MRAVAIKNKCIKLAREYNNLIDTSVIPNDEHLTGYFNLVSLYNGSPVYRFYVNSNEFINLIWSILGYYTNWDKIAVLILQVQTLTDNQLTNLKIICLMQLVYPQKHQSFRPSKFE
jgi:hypothetical protein